MDFRRETFCWDNTDDGMAAILAAVQPGMWAVEAGGEPPAWHDPGNLPRFGDQAFAFSLSAAIAMQVSLGPPLIERLGSFGGPANMLAGLALHELIVNAALHGNLAVASGNAARWRDLDARRAMIGRALADFTRARRLVTIMLYWSDDLAGAVISDDGAGYDPDRILIDKRGAGRGLRLAAMVGRIERHFGGRQVIIHFTAPARD
jgi:hypothetical protein